MSTRTDIVLRPHRPADVPEFVRIVNAANEADGIGERTSVPNLTNWLLTKRGAFDPETDITVATVGDEIAGYGFLDWTDTTDGLREYRSRGHVAPAWRRQGIGTAILARNEARAREMAAGYEGGRQLVYGSWAAERRTGAIFLLTRNGYEPIRYFFDMVRPDLERIDVPPLPEGIEIRPINDEAGYRKHWEADIEAFQDHWGGFDASEESYQQWKADPDFDPSLFVIGWDGDQIAGSVVNEINEAENAALGRRRGLLAGVFVRRPWRRRGLASALVARSLVLLRERGMTSAWLGVDADNPTGALGVYERAGFGVDMRSTAYRKPLVLDR